VLKAMGLALVVMEIAIDRIGPICLLIKDVRKINKGGAKSVKESL